MTPDERREALRSSRERLHVLVALAAALGRWPEVARVVLEAEGDRTARDAVARMLGLDDVQARAVLDLQVRRVTKQARRRLGEEIDELEGSIAALQEG